MKKILHIILAINKKTRSSVVVKRIQRVNPIKSSLVCFVGYKASRTLLEVINQMISQGYSNLAVVTNLGDGCQGCCQDQDCFCRQIRSKLRVDWASFFNQKQHPDITRLLTKYKEDIAQVLWVINPEHEQYTKIINYLGIE